VLTPNAYFTPHFNAYLREGIGASKSIGGYLYWLFSTTKNLSMLKLNVSEMGAIVSTHN